MKFHCVAFKRKHEDSVNVNDHSSLKHSRSGVSLLPYLATLIFQATFANPSSVWLVQQHFQNKVNIQF